DILYLRNIEISSNCDQFRETGPQTSAEPITAQPGLALETDASVQIHSCHSPMREIEVLYDNLLAMFEQAPDLLPKDIIIMTPDIELYGPYVQAVFDTQTDERLRVPFSIADQSVRRESRIIEGFLSLLNLPGSRFSVPQVMALLEIPGVKENFDLTESDIALVENWIKATNIRWGIDAHSRDQLGLPAFSENTWRTGVERLLLGYALPGHERRMFAGILPYEHIEGNEVIIFGKFLEFLDRLFKAADTLQHRRSLAEWHTILEDLIEQFIAPQEEIEREIQVLRRMFENLDTYQELSGFDQDLPIEVLRSYFKNHLEKEHFGTGFITSGVTFCAMLPMRSIPFKVICLVGMNYDAFPRASKTMSFDLIRENPRIGDRSRRNDDKYLFLEALISARKKLYISFVGQSVQDNSQSPPSVLVSELLDYIQEGFGIPAGQVITHHKLQGFSPEYFKKAGRLFSYSKENYAAAGSLQEPCEIRPLITDALPMPPPKWKHIDIDTLCAFFSNPAKLFAQKRLGIYLTETKTISEETESFSLDGLEKYLVGQDLVETRLSESEDKDDFSVQQAQGRLPHGNVGKLVYNEMRLDAETFVQKIESLIKGHRAETREVDLEIAQFHLSGRIANIYDGGLVQLRYAAIKPKYLLNTWIYHLILCVLVQNDSLKNSLLVCKNGVRAFERVNNAADLLENLLSLYWKGMSEPLRFFPESSFEYVQKLLLKDQAEPMALNGARQKWLASDFARGESDDPYYDLCFKSIDPLDDDFQNIAQDVFGPLLNHCTEIIL
ncbi:MAG: exodeoxyribonuclease V subunit gamma, partial [Proteobacteria bacterium]|nr:exodeoxyribonuclease V subunit gamma [Pseudomonadota bacterium]